MNIKIRSLLIVMLIIVSSIIVMPTSVSAEEPILPTDKDVYFRSPEVPTHTYNYNYTSDPEVITTEVADQAVTYYWVENSIILSANVWEVMSGDYTNKVRVFVSAVGYYDVTDWALDDPRDVSHYVGTTGLNMEMRVVDIQGSTNPMLHIQKEWASSNNMTAGPWGGTQPVHPTIQNTTEFTIRYAVGMKDKYGLIGIAEFAYNEYKASGGSGEHQLGDSDSGPNAHVGFHWDHPRWFSYDEPAWQPLRRFYSAGILLELDVPTSDLPESLTLEFSANNEIGVYDYGTDDFTWGPVDGAETSVDITIKNARLDAETDEDAFNVSVPSGKLYTSQFTPTGEFERVYPSISFDLVDNIIEDGTPEYRVKIYTVSTISTDEERLHHTFTAVGAGSSWDDVTMETYFKWDDWKNLDDGLDNGDNEVRISITRVVVEAWSEYGGWTYVQEFDPDDHSDGMYWDMVNDIEMAIEVTAPAPAVEEDSYGTHQYQFRVDNNVDITGEFTMEVTSDTGWPVSVHPEAFYLSGGSHRYVDVTVNIPDGVPDGASTDVTLTATASPYTGGGSWCPYVSPWNGTDYQFDNNILIASEHQGGIVDDHYILQNNVEPKDGYYSLKIEEFENSKDHFDMVKLYTIDHQEGYEIATTPEGEYIAYREPRPALSAYDSDGEDVLRYLNTTGNGALSVDEDSWVILNFGEITKSQWEHNKLVVVSHGFESYTQPPSDIYPWLPPVKTSLHASMRMDDSEWVDITVLHPRNNPSAMVIPLNETLEEFFPGRKGNILGELEVKILSTDDHYIDFVGIDDTVPAEPTKVQEAALTSALLNGETDVTDLLSTNDTEMVTLIPGEHISLDFDIPEQSPAPVFSERSYMLYSRGYYELFMGANEVENTILSTSDELLSQTVTASDDMTVTFNHPGSSVSVTRPQDMTVSDYGTYTVEFTVENQGDLWDTYDLMVTETEGWTVTVVDSVTLNPGASVPVEVEVNIPTTASDGTSTIELRATSRHGGQTDSANMKVNFVYQHPGSSVSVNAPSNAYESTTGTKTYTFTVRNTGSLADTYDLILTQVSGKHWARTIDGDTSISLSAGETKNVYVKVTIPSSASHEDYMVVRLSATSQHGGQTNSDTMRVTFVEPPYVEITSPKDGAAIPALTEPTSITVSWEGESGIDNYWIRLDGGSWINVGTSTSYTFEDLYLGSYTVTVRARRYGVYGYDSVSFTIEEFEGV